MTERTGFLEESPGVKSATRLTALILACGAVLPLAWACAALALRDPKDAAGPIAAMGAVIAGLAVGIWGALRERTGGTDA